MKKPNRPFTFEVKRSRLSSPKASTFQRYVAAPEVDPARRTPDGSGLQVAIGTEPPPLPLPARILPSLMSERVWREEPEVPLHATAQGLEAPQIVEEPEATIEADPAASEIIASAGNLPQEEPEPLRRAKSRAKFLGDLPRSQRWKRRLPRAAW